MGYIRHDAVVAVAWTDLAETAARVSSDVESLTKHVREHRGNPAADCDWCPKPDRPTLSDDDLREEAARRGMTVVDAQEWARVRAIADGPTPATDEAACPTCGCPTECPEGLAEERDRLRAGIEALAAAAKGADVVWAAMEAAGIRATRGGAA